MFRLIVAIDSDETLKVLQSFVQGRKDCSVQNNISSATLYGTATALKEFLELWQLITLTQN